LGALQTEKSAVTLADAGADTKDTIAPCR
jgi:hypothetical protein